ncbi:arginine/serine-rich protein 1 [Cottoperca gobio]|uniref:Arginine/serine-rich protein 1 n=1 Tax=Cottoperca gobio TaxID=56716 RepID=A0A6J2S554_COTGO|nr:arginine/serine-rich protein 1 [Cottoperca gobio]
MAKGEESHSEMAHDRQSDGINVIFDQNSPASSRSRSRSRSSSGSKLSPGSGRFRGRGSHRRRHKSSSSSRSPTHTRSRSHTRCRRPSSHCRCDNHRKNGRGRQSPPRRSRAHSRSSSRRSRRAASPSSQSITHRGDSRSGSSENSVNLSLDDKGELLTAAKVIATTILEVEKLELPESVKPILLEQSEFKRVSLDTWVRQDPEKTLSQSDEEEPDDMFSSKMSPKRKTISFSINNSLFKPSLASQSSAKVTSRVDSFDSRKPYGHWVRVKSGQSSNVRKHAFATSH